MLGSAIIGARFRYKRGLRWPPEGSPINSLLSVLQDVRASRKKSADRSRALSAGTDFGGFSDLLPEGRMRFCLALRHQTGRLKKMVSMFLQPTITNRVDPQAVSNDTPSPHRELVAPTVRHRRNPARLLAFSVNDDLLHRILECIQRLDHRRDRRIGEI